MQNCYIHTDSNELIEFAKQITKNTVCLYDIIENLFSWFDCNVKYSRLNSPYLPLQRSDLDVLRMQSGTCGDYSSLIVATLLALGYDAKYAFVDIDCYGNAQDHICAAVTVDINATNNKTLDCEAIHNVKQRNEAPDKGTLFIDATLPYRKWWRSGCPHQKCRILTPAEFEASIKTEEKQWTDTAIEYGNKGCAGLLYAPWIHEQVVLEQDDLLETVFFMLFIHPDLTNSISVYYLVYTEDKCFASITADITNQQSVFRFSVYPSNGIWDDSQWSNAYESNSIPYELKTERLQRFTACMDLIIPQIEDIVAKMPCDN